MVDVTTPPTICCVNCGSSSVKLNLYTYINAQLDSIKSHHSKGNTDAKQAFKELGHSLQDIDIIVHRFVNGGELRKPTIIDDKILQQLKDTVQLDKLHNEPAVDFIVHCAELIQQSNTKTKQAVVFDTEFYTDVSDEHKLYALPKLDTKYPIIRYSFHGIAHESMLNQYNSIPHYDHNKNTIPVLDRNFKLITLQLGSGCSATAIHNNKPIYSSMGFSPLEGLVMSTRSGTIDASIVLYLQRELKMSADKIETLLYHKSGLLGITNGYSNDMQNILDSDKTECKTAVNLFVNRVIQTIGSYTALLNGCDSICFGGGIGENSSTVRHLICDKLEWLGVKLDLKANTAKQFEKITCISLPDSKVSVYVVPVDEAILMAEKTVALQHIH